MDGPSHYREAEKLLERASLSAAPEPEYLAAAQVHATLALAAAQRVSGARTPDGGWPVVDAARAQQLANRTA